ncbi:MAG: L-threonylcarbamoyladenylate synthase [Phycisphaerae bacterium]
MRTEVLKVDPADAGGVALRAASEVLRRGGLVAFPTETVYGVGARADDPDAMTRLRTAKSCSPERAFTVHVGSTEASTKYASRWSGVARRLAHKGWPGPLTLIVPAAAASAPIMAGLDPSAAGAMFYDGTVGLRCPDHAVALSLLHGVGVPIVAASANVTGKPAPTSADDVLDDLGHAVDLVLDAGPTRYAKPSTVVRATGRSFEIVRAGVYDERTIRAMACLRLLFVCTGNTCRSPMAAALARAAIAKRLGCDASDLPALGVHIESAGTSGGGGGAADHAIAVMARRGIDVSGHRSRSLTTALIEQADHIYTMTAAHEESVMRMAPSARRRVTRLLGDRDVVDPFGGTEDDYERTAQAIDAGLAVRLEDVAL